jgi:hypothetical protein
MALLTSPKQLTSMTSSATIYTPPPPNPCVAQSMSFNLYATIDVYVWMNITIIQTLATVAYNVIQVLWPQATGPSERAPTSFPPLSCTLVLQTSQTSSCSIPQIKSIEHWLLLTLVDRES